MTRAKIIIFCALCIMLPFSSANALGIKENSFINDDTIKLGDLFYDLESNEDRVLGNSPSPGEKMVINARTLLRIAVALDLPWRPSNNSDHVTIHREATIIEYDQIKEKIHAALNNENIYSDYEITIPAQYHKIVLPNDQPAEMVITKFKLDRSNNRFIASIAAPSAENPIKQFKIRGSIDPIITVPVLYSNLQRGSVITKKDIRFIKIKEREFTRDTIADANKLLGMSARRMIIAGRPIKSVELIPKQIIDRGSLVTLSLNSGILNLTTQAKALENGAKGEVIRVVNTASNKTLQAIVTGENSVAIIQN